MKNIYRNILWTVNVLISFLLILTTILLGIFINNKIYVTIMVFISVYIINAIISLWIVTSKIRTQSTKLAWLLSFFLFPVISILIYLIWGISPYKIHTSVEYKQKYKKYLEKYSKGFYTGHNYIFSSLNKYIKNVRDSNITNNNDIKVLTNGKEFYDNIIELISNAKQHIFLCYYIIDNGKFYYSIAKKLIDKANQGIKIYLIFDRYGCTKKFRPKMLYDLLIHPNIEIAKFESNKDKKLRSTNNFRSHKKILIIDNKTAIYGGSNIADEYLTIKNNTPNWKDLNFRISGPLIKTMLIDFCMDWDENGKLPYIFQLSDYKNCPKILIPILYLKSWLYLHRLTHKELTMIQNRKITRNLFDEINKYHYFDESNNSNEVDEIKNNAVYVPTGPRYYNNIISDILNHCICGAKKSLKIITPYFIMTDSLVTSFIMAAKRGVKIEIILPGSCDDKSFLLDMNRMFYNDLLNAEINIYEYAGFIHSKLFIVDNEIAVIGTFNIDYRSLNSNYESLVILDNENTIKNLNEYFNSCIKNSIEFSKYKLFASTTLLSSFIKGALIIIQPLL